MRVALCMYAIARAPSRPDMVSPPLPTDHSTMFTMSMEQFVMFARDCRALAPSTPVTVGEVRGRDIQSTRQFVATYASFDLTRSLASPNFSWGKVV